MSAMFVALVAKGVLENQPEHQVCAKGPFLAPRPGVLMVLQDHLSASCGNLLLSTIALGMESFFQFH